MQSGDTPSEERLTSRIVIAKDTKTRVTTQTGTNGKGETTAITMLCESKSHRQSDA
jgi:hypothetical protein